MFSIDKCLLFFLLFWQKTFSEYTERTAFERPLTSGVAYALKVLHSEREQFERKHGWTIKKHGWTTKEMDSRDQALVQDYNAGNLDAVPMQDEYAPVIFSQETVSHIISMDMMSGKVGKIGTSCTFSIFHMALILVIS